MYICLCVHKYITYKYLPLDSEKYAHVNTDIYFNGRQHFRNLQTYACHIIKVLTESTNQLLELIRDFGKVFGYKIKMQTWKGSYTPAKISWKNNVNNPIHDSIKEYVT